LHVIAASSVSEIDAAFIAAKRQGANALRISSDPFLHSRRKQIVALALFMRSRRLVVAASGSQPVD
jgi:hypothetical protein